MHIDKTTLQDLSIFHKEEEQSIFYKLNFTQTNGGKEYLRAIMAEPLFHPIDVIDAQKTIFFLTKKVASLPQTITNGTIMVLESFFDTVVNNYPKSPNFINGFAYKVFNSPDYAITKYSVQHFIGFIQDLKTISTILTSEDASTRIEKWVEQIKTLLQKDIFDTIVKIPKSKKLTATENIRIALYLKHHFKNEALKLIDIYHQLDAYSSLAKACNNYSLQFPLLVFSENPRFKTEGLYHLLLKEPVSYDIELREEKNFMFLTGANMAGKSTFIKAVGIAAYLAHIGMAVPAKSMQLTLFDGLLTNIQIEDNILKGESFFFNEVQRIKRNIDKIMNGKRWLVLIDELFKGTNVQDAMKCSTTVIEGLLKAENVLYILSTHLYEIAETLTHYPNIDFRYFETAVVDEQLSFNYQLIKGVSNDRLGYLILKREGVVDMLKQIN